MHGQQNIKFSWPVYMNYVNVARNSLNAYLNEKYFEKKMQRVTKYISGTVNFISPHVSQISV
jgi:hypothetical protein